VRNGLQAWQSMIWMELGIVHDLSGANRPALCNSDAVMIGVVGVLNRH
jgi:hypothetical protein